MAGYVEYTAPGGAAVELELSQVQRSVVRTIYADDDINPAYIEGSLTVRARFTADTEALFYTKLRLLEQAIMTPRGRLIIASDSTKTNIYHDIRPAGTGTGGDQPDINSGPKPRDLTVDVFYAGLGANLTWTVDYGILPCGLSQPALPGVLYKTFATDFDYAQDGTLTRRTTGELRIPDKHTDTEHGPIVQQAIGQCYVPVAKGWVRTAARFGVSTNGLVLQYQYQDQELEIGWHQFLQSVDATWTEDIEWLEFPTVTLDIRAKAKRGVGKRRMMAELILPMIDQHFGDLGSNWHPIRVTYEQNLFTNEIRASATVRALKPLKINTPLQEIPRPTGLFGDKLPMLTLDEPFNITVGQSGDSVTTNFDPLLTREGATAARFLSLPTLTRAIIKGLCDRTALAQPADYGEFAADSITVGMINPTPPEVSGEGEDTLYSGIYKEGNTYAIGDYMVDEEVITVEVKYFTEVIGNQNAITIDGAGVVATDDTKSQRLYQSRIPVLVVKAVGRAVRIGEPAEPRPIPIIHDADGATELQTVPKKIRITNFGPIPLDLGNVAGYGVQWVYESTKELSGTLFEIDATTQLTKLRIPTRPTRVDAIFTDEVMEKFDWEPTT